MIVRDLARLLLNLLIGPVFGFVGFMAALRALLVLPLEGGGALASRPDGGSVLLVLAAPFILVAHRFGALLGLITALRPIALILAFIGPRRVPGAGATVG